MTDNDGNQLLPEYHQVRALQPPSEVFNGRAFRDKGNEDSLWDTLGSPDSIICNHLGISARQYNTFPVQ